MKKRILSLFLAISLLLPGMLTVPVSAAATSGSCGNTLTWSFNSTTGTLTISGTGTMTDYSDPSVVPWYTYRYQIKTLNLSEGLTSIGSYAFAYESSLTGVTIPSTVTRIGTCAFYYCSKLASAPLPAGLTSIGNSAFFDCALTTVDIPVGVTEILNSTFADNDITTLTIPGTVKTIGDSAFANCTALTDVTIQEGVTTVKNYAFDGCAALENLSVPASVTSLGYITDEPMNTRIQVAPASESYCTDENGLLLSKDRTNLLYCPSDAVGSTFRIPEGITTLAPMLFQKNETLSTVQFPDSLTTIGSNAFSDCINLKRVILPDGVTTVGNSAFDGCTSLSAVTLPNSITSMGGWVFNGCTSLPTVDLPDGITTLAGGMFFGCTSLTHVDIPDGVTSIGSEAFYECTSLQYLLIPDGVETVGNYAFRYSGLVSITFPESVTSLGSYVLANCKSLKEVTLSRGLTKIPDHAFYFSRALDTLTFPYTVTYVGELAVYNTGLRNKNIFFVGTKEQMHVGIEKSSSSDRNGNYNTELSMSPWTYIDPIEPTSVSIQGGNSLAIGSTVQFRATVLPREAFDRSVTWTSSDPTVATVSTTGVVTGVKDGAATITATTSNGLTASNIVKVKGEGLTITVNGYSEEDFLADPINFQPSPLPGASVTLDGVTKTADDDGQVTFAEAELSKSGSSKIIVSYDNTYEVKETYIYYSTKREHTYNLARLSGKIQFQSVSAYLNGKDKDLLATQTRNYISYLNEDATDLNKTATLLNITVDWGRYQDNESDRKIWLSGENGQYVPLQEGKNYVVLTDYFQAEEHLSLTATTRDEDSNEVKVQRGLPLGLKVINVSLNVQDTESVSMSNLSYLDDLSTEIKVGDLLGFGGKVSMENGVLTAEFEKGDTSEQKEVSLFGGFLEGKAGPEVSIGGRVQIPITKTGAGTWSGGVKVFMGQSANIGDIEDPETLAELFSTTYNFTISGIPLYVDSTLKAGLEGVFSVGGTLEKSGVSGTMEPQGEFALGGGIGAGYDVGSDELAVKFGAEGALNAKLPVTYTMTSISPFEADAIFEPEIKGTVSAKMVVKIMNVDLEGKLDLGSVTWNKNGVTWQKIEDMLEPAVLSLDEENWQVGSRDYLENGSGFTGGAQLMLLAGDEEEVPTEQILYANISPYSDGEVALADGVPTLLFTDDDTSRTAANALSVSYSRYVDGIWSEPVPIDNDGTLDTGVSANGKLVAWENSNVEFDDSVTLDEMLKATDIKAAVWDAETGSYIVTAFPSAADYEFGVEVAQYEDYDTGIAAWLSNSEGDLTGQTGTNSLHYSTYKNGVWSNVVTVKDIGVVTNLEVYCFNGTAFVFYKNTETGKCYLLNTRKTTNKPISQSKFEGLGRYDYNGDLATYLDADKILRITSGSTEYAAIQTAYQGSENPVLISSNYGEYVFWTDADGLCYATNASGSWSGKICLDDSDAIFASVSAVVVEKNNCLVSYYRTQDGVTDLVTQPLTSSPDLSLDRISYDMETYGETGNVQYTLTVTNRGTLAAENVLVYFYEDDACVYIGDIHRPIAPGETYSHTAAFHPVDGTVAHDYTVVLSAPGDTGTNNNTGTMTVGSTDLSISQSWFGEDDFGTGTLTIFVENSGDLDVDNATVTVYKDSTQSDPIAQLETGAVSAGRTVQFTLNEEQDRNAVYYVTVTVDGDTDPYNDLTLLAYDNMKNPNLEITAFRKDTTVTVHLARNDNPAAEAALIWAVYGSDGQMKQSQMEKVDLSAAPTLRLARELDRLTQDDTVSVFLVEPDSLVPLTDKLTLKVE